MVDSTSALPTSTHSSEAERNLRSAFHEHYRGSPIPADQQLVNLGLFMNRQALSRILFLHELYGYVLDVPGVLIEFGVRWGQTLAVLANLRGIYEPFSYLRKIVGFDTFAGFPSIHELDGSSPAASVGSYGVTEGYENYLAAILDYHERESPISHVRKYELVKGDVKETLPEYLRNQPQTVVALAYFDLDLYEPTRDCLTAIAPHLTRGSVLAFDELNHPDFPGETAAVKEVIGLDRYRLRRSRFSPYASYLIVD